MPSLRCSRILFLLAVAASVGLHFLYFSSLTETPAPEPVGANELIQVPSLVVTPITDSFIGKEYRFDWHSGEERPYWIGRIIYEDDMYFEQILQFKQVAAVQPGDTTLVYVERKRMSTERRQEGYLWIEVVRSYEYDPGARIESFRFLQSVFDAVPFSGRLDLGEEESTNDTGIRRLFYRGRLYRMEDEETKHSKALSADGAFFL